MKNPMLIVKPTTSGIAAAVRLLKRGGVIVYPTDTAYALGGCYDRTSVTRRVLQIKQRRDSRFTVIAGSVNQATKHFSFSPLAKKIIKKYWPGPLSVVASSRYAVRVPNSSIARMLALRAGCPLLASSANLSGQPTSYSIRQVVRYFAKQKNRPDLIIDVGRLPRRKPSTVVAIQKKCQILRDGRCMLTRQEVSGD